MTSQRSGRPRVVVTGAGTISPLGDRPAAIHQALVAGADGLGEITLFPVDGLPTRRAGEIRFDPKAYLEGNIRPIDRTGQLAIIAAQLALAASGWSREKRAEHEVSLVLGTTFGSVRTIAEFDRRAVEAGPQYAKPFDFANSVINAAAGQTAIWHRLRGVNSTLAGSAAAGLQAIAYAVDLIRSGRADAVLAGGAEELCFESFYGYSRTGRLAADGDCAVPFDARRRGFRLGEGAALLVLEEAGAARRRGATVLAEIRGHAGAFDCSRGRDAGEAAAAIGRTLALALDDAGVDAAEVDAVSLAADGSPAGDRHEAAGVAACFGARAAELAVLAVKGQLGESLGAAGAFQTLALLETMHQGKVPGIAGLAELEDDFPLTRASAESHAADVRRGLVHALGLDGNTCALVLERIP